PAPKASQRLYYKGKPETNGYPPDIIPFRGVEEPVNVIKWPPEMAIIMNVVGYEEALRTAHQVEVAPNSVAPVASLSGIALLKIFAWRDRGELDSKDALDL